MFCLISFSVSQRWHSLSDFLISNDAVGVTLRLRLNMEILKSAVLLANEHQSDQKKMLQMIFV